MGLRLLVLSARTLPLQLLDSNIPLLGMGILGTQVNHRVELGTGDTEEETSRPQRGISDP